MKKPKYRLTPADSNFGESSRQGRSGESEESKNWGLGSLLSPVRSLAKLRSRSRSSLDSLAHGSGISSSSTNSDFPDYQEHNRILQTRIELTTKNSQRRPFRVKKASQRGSREGPRITARVPRSDGLIPKSLLHGVSSSPPDQTYDPTQSWIFAYCRQELARPCRGSKGGHQGTTRETENINENNRGGFQLIDKVIHVKCQAENIGTVLMDSSRDLIAISDREGKIFIHDYDQDSYPEISCFQMSDQGSKEDCTAVLDTVDIVSLFSLSPDGSLDRLLSCNADGSVRIWDHCTEQESCSLRTGWQAVPVFSPPNYVLTPCSFDYQAKTGTLFSSSLSSAGVVYQVDVETEALIQQFSIDKNTHPSVDFIRSYHHSPNLLAASSDDGMIRVFDLRTEHFIGGIRPFPNQGGPISAMTPMTDEKLCVMSYGGLMKILDIRQTNTSVVSSLVASSMIRAHSTGCTSALSTHRNRPVLASATLHPVVKIWNYDGEQMGAIRPLRSYKDNCQQAITCLNFHPTKDLFAASGKGPICGIYTFVKKQ